MTRHFCQPQLTYIAAENDWHCDQVRAWLQGLSQYGNGFLAKFEAAACPNQLLEEVTLVDTPGVLSGEKQRIEVRPGLPSSTAADASGMLAMRLQTRTCP